MLKSKIRRNQEVFKIGDNIYWKLTNNILDWSAGTVMAVDGKLLLVRSGNQFYRVHTNMAVKKNTEYDRNGKLMVPKEVEETQERRKTTPRRRQILVSIDESDEAGQDNGGEEEVGVPEDEGQADAEDPGGEPGDSSTSEGETVDSSQMEETETEQERETPEEHIGSDDQRRPAGPDEEMDLDDVFEPPTVADKNVMLREEIRERTIATKRMAATSPGTTRTRQSKKRPKVTPTVNLKKKDLIILNGNVCEIVARAGKATGSRKNWYNVRKVDSEEPTYSIDLGNGQFEKVSETAGSQQVMMTSEGQVEEEVLMQTIPFSQHGNQECTEAKRIELKKIVEEFKAVEEVEDKGQFRISCRWVLWYKKHSDGQVQTRARLVARGFQEKDHVPSDSPTCDNVSLKMLLSVAQAKGWKLNSLDVKSAFLQGLELTERDVFVTPPPEARVEKGKLWRCKISLYGLDDASLRFHFKVKQVFASLDVQQSRYDPALFYMKDKNTAELLGVITTHVDDFLLMGNQKWLDEMAKKIGEKFVIGRVESENFVYCGHRIKMKDGVLTLDQREFAEEVRPMVIKPDRRRQTNQPVTDAERKMLRSYAGKLGWLARTTRPDLYFAQIEASCAVTKATVGDLKDLAKAVARVGQQDSITSVPRMGDIKDWRLELYTDASWQNLRQTGSTAGKVLMLVSGEQRFPILWTSNRLQRVCHSSQAAEVMAINLGMKDTIYLQSLAKELLDVDLKVTLLIDNKNCRDSVTSNVAPHDRRVRCELAGIREALLTGEIEGIKLISGRDQQQLADALTKKGAPSDRLLAMVQGGEGGGGQRH